MWNQARQAQLVSLYMSGATMAKIRLEFGHSMRWLYRRLAEVGVMPSRQPKRERKYPLVEDDPLTPVVRKMRQQGATLKDIARDLKKSKDYIRRRVPRIYEDEKIPKRKTTVVTPEEIQKMISFYNDGMPVERVARLLNRSRTATREHLEAAGCLGKPNHLRRQHLARVPWPKITTTPKRAYRGGKRYEDVPNLFSVPECVAIRNAALLR